MAKAKKKLLPKNFEELLREGDISRLKLVFEACEVNARGGHAKQTALAFEDCTDDLACWLVSMGADISATDTWGNTPLHTRSRSCSGNIKVILELGADVNNTTASIGTPLHAAASSYEVKNTALLINWGANINAQNSEGLTPLELALRGCSNINIEDMASLAEKLLAAGASITSKMKEYVEEIGMRFEFHRVGFNPNFVNSVSEALNKIYKIFDVDPKRKRLVHDGKSEIFALGGPWQERHKMLWDFLVPSNGAATTVQGKVIRITGRIHHELEDNGGVNWDADFCKMAEAFIDYVQKGNPLSSSEISVAEEALKRVQRKSDGGSQMAELAVEWVARNPVPMALSAPKYKR